MEDTSKDSISLNMDFPKIHPKKEWQSPISARFYTMFQRYIQQKEWQSPISARFYTKLWWIFRRKKYPKRIQPITAWVFCARASGRALHTWKLSGRWVVWGTTGYLGICVKIQSNIVGYCGVWLDMMKLVWYNWYNCQQQGLHCHV